MSLFNWKHDILASLYYKCGTFEELCKREAFVGIHGYNVWVMLRTLKQSNLVYEKNDIYYASKSSKEKLIKLNYDVENKKPDRKYEKVNKENSKKNSNILP